MLFKLYFVTNLLLYESQSKFFFPFMNRSNWPTLLCCFTLYFVTNQLLYESHSKFFLPFMNRYNWPTLLCFFILSFMTNSFLQILHSSGLSLFCKDAAVTIFWLFAVLVPKYCIKGLLYSEVCLSLIAYSPGYFPS